MKKIQISSLIQEIKPKDPRLWQILMALLRDLPKDAGDLVLVDSKTTVDDAIKDIYDRAMFDGDPAGGDLEGTYPNPSISQDFINRLIAAISSANPRLLYVLTTTVTVNMASRTSLLSPSYSLPAGYFNKIGKSIRVKASGYMSTGNPAPTIQVGLDLDAAPILDTGLRELHPNIPNRYWDYEAILTYRGSNRVIGQAAFHYESTPL